MCVSLVRQKNGGGKVGEWKKGLLLEDLKIIETCCSALIVCPHVSIRGTK